jgi:hypothetical protein
VIPGTEVRVAAGNRKAIQGKLESVTESNLVVERGGNTQTFQRPEIQGIFVKTRGHRRRNTLVGLALGTAIGVGIGVGIGAAQSNGCKQILCGLSTPVDGAIGGVVGLVAGTLTGVSLPTGTWRQIYAR